MCTNTENIGSVLNPAMQPHINYPSSWKKLCGVPNKKFIPPISIDEQEGLPDLVLPADATDEEIRVFMALFMALQSHIPGITFVDEARE